MRAELPTITARAVATPRKTADESEQNKTKGSTSTATRNRRKPGRQHADRERPRLPERQASAAGTRRFFDAEHAFARIRTQAGPKSEQPFAGSQNRLNSTTAGSARTEQDSQSNAELTNPPFQPTPLQQQQFTSSLHTGGQEQISSAGSAGARRLWTDLYAALSLKLRRIFQVPVFPRSVGLGTQAAVYNRTERFGKLGISSANKRYHGRWLRTGLRINATGAIAAQLLRAGASARPRSARTW